MSAVLDFRDLRDKVLAGEMDEDEEPVETPLGIEAKQKGTLAAICVSVAFLSLFMAMTDSLTRMRRCLKALCPRSFSPLEACLSLGYALGGLNRGINAQTEKERYERLLDDSQTVIEEQQEEIESMEAEAEEEKEAEAQQESYHFDYLNAEDAFHHAPSLSVLSLHSVKKA